ncbi:MAG: hypothetical protein DHS20C10_12120 [marine bacterium B5-7]|nr:MAG: hypothetical protein DHS20C10_12120 [marine bacterium B5-7]
MPVRTQEIRTFNALCQRQQAEFLAVYGRRRVGKTYLIRHYFKEKGLYFELTGSRGANLSTQLQHFANSFSDAFQQGKPIPCPDSWQSAFDTLRKQIADMETEQRIVLFFDELPWLASKRSGFLAALEYLWNRYLSQDKRVILIVCGSAAAWMIKKVVKDKGGLHGRLTAQMRLLPFTLQETESFLQEQGIQWDRAQITDLYLVIGGVAKYLTYVDPTLSATQNIDKICFAQNAPLLKEFEQLYASLFESHTRHIAIIRALSKKFYGLTKNELFTAANLSSGGTSSQLLDELVQSGFIKEIPWFGKNKHNSLYRLIDQYSMFYLKWIEPNVKDILGNENFWLLTQQTSKAQAWAGYAFENICFQHLQPILKAMGLGAVNTRIATWRKLQGRQRGQIDLIVDRADKCINLCEIKYVQYPLTIDKQSRTQLQQRQNLLREETQTKKSMFHTLISPYGEKQSADTASIFQQQVTLDDLFL